ncbi:copper chaperone PCu(A)C [Paralimibaculum aggregatum]|uniref:Copper chaperone PCu(A)C n=1 Tax=Paralimibaculum aggregatum TaxID=3036245 RepID=A0ABQ6LJR0_9RHOB|nr:copper chaperone PCu(A)C [Limibaculum sp. NKW23]
MLLVPALAAALLAAATPALAHEFTLGALVIDHPWARPNLPNRPAAAYVEITNGGETADRLLAASSPAFETVELHTMEMADGVMKMMRVEAVELPAGATVALAPGRHHMMLFGAAGNFRPGDSFPMTLSFEAAGEIEVEVKVEMKPSSEMHGGGHRSDDGGHGTKH